MSLALAGAPLWRRRRSWERSAATVAIMAIALFQHLGVDRGIRSPEGRAFHADASALLAQRIPAWNHVRQGARGCACRAHMGEPHAWKKRMAAHEAGVAAGKWICGCNALNFPTSDECFKCGASRPRPAPDEAGVEALESKVALETLAGVSADEAEPKHESV
mmetsp:Transcript_18693/g.51299  ORF Transcript_18693/g.51299 Transcript_18693/m.51299 type:complete len:162 (+) Transcript_18693:54-539(+)